VKPVSVGVQPGGTFTFDFEEKPPYLISQLGIDVKGGE
jgi:hypothetical protein